MTASTKPDRQSAAAAEARGARLLVGIIGGGFLLLIAAFVGMIFFVHDEARLNAVGPIAAEYGDFKKDDLNLSLLGENQPEAQRIFNEVGFP